MKHALDVIEKLKSELEAVQQEKSDMSALEDSNARLLAENKLMRRQLQTIRELNMGVSDSFKIASDEQAESPDASSADVKKLIGKRGTMPLPTNEQLDDAEAILSGSNGALTD